MAPAPRRHGPIRMVHRSAKGERTCKGCERTHDWRLQCACGHTFYAPVGTYDGDHMEAWWREHLAGTAWRHKPASQRTDGWRIGIPLAPRRAVPIAAGLNMAYLIDEITYGPFALLNPAVVVLGVLTSWVTYSGSCRLFRDGKTVGMSVPARFRVPSGKQPTATGRQPAVWPPEPGRCFICGMYDTADHPECQEWLGDWKPTLAQQGEMYRWAHELEKAAAERFTR